MPISIHTFVPTNCTCTNTICMSIPIKSPINHNSIFISNIHTNTINTIFMTIPFQTSRQNMYSTKDTPNGHIYSILHEHVTRSMQPNIYGYLIYCYRYNGTSGNHPIYNNCNRTTL